jgi:hypothetical protein
VAYRILWVNPLADSPGYQPLARGMAAALPFVDRFLPGDTAEALFGVLEALSDDEATSDRHQRVVTPAV